MIDNVKKTQRDISLDYIRTVAMLMIVFCHFFQIINCLNLAFWLNTGVQIFLILSARLMYKKRFENWKQIFTFYKDKLIRIMLPVWIYLFAICAVLLLIKYPLSIKAAIVYALGGAAFIKSGVLGLGHFWYISIILIAYILVPVLSLFADRLKKAKLTAFIPVCIFALTFLVAIFYLVGNASYGVNLGLFVISYYVFSRYSDTENREKKMIKLIWLPTLVMIVARLLLEHFGVSEWKHYGVYDSVFVPICKSLLAFLVYSGIYVISSKTRCKWLDKIVLAVSAVSFEVYITHQFIELAVYEYVPYCNSGTLLSGVLMLAVSAVLIIINTIALRLAQKIVIKTVSVVKK